MVPPPESLEMIPEGASPEKARLTIVRNYKAYHLVRSQLVHLQQWVRERIIDP